MDADLCLLARSAGRLRLALGSGLDALARTGGHHELGFSSVEAYALERCERSARWVQQIRALVRRLSELPAIRRALVAGSLGFSMAQVLVKVARPETELAWLADARSRTVRQMRALVEERRRQEQTAERAGGSGATAVGELAGAESAVDENPSCEEEGPRRCTLSVTVDQEDAWLFECARMIAKQAGGPTTEETVEALLGEGTTTLFESMERDGDFCLPGDEPEDSGQQAWEAQLARWRDEAEVLCEARFDASAGRAVSREGTDVEGVPPAGSEVGGDDEAERAGAGNEVGKDDGPEITIARDAMALDARLRRAATQLAVRDVELGALAETFWKADGWRRLGYATDAQYARERLGTSLTSVKARRGLARHALRLPALGDAIRSGSIGYEAARLVASVATEETLPAWLARARERTVKHLREEVDAAQMLARLGAGAGARPLAPGRRAPRRPARRGPATLADANAPGPSAHRWPPSDEAMRDLAALESHIVSGAVFRDDVPTDGQISAGDTAAAFLWKLSGAVSAFLEKLERRESEGNGRGVEPSWLEGAASNGRALPAGAPMVPSGPARRMRDRARGRVTLRLAVTADLRRYYRWLERLFERRGPRGVPFVRFLCASLVQTWKHSLGSCGAYREVYARDRYRCTSPVCTSRQVTPHHLQFRSAGGDDSNENLTSLCVWCHLEGIHRGRLCAAPPASDVTWTLGQRGQEHTTVRGRQRARGDTRAAAT